MEMELVKGAICTLPKIIFYKIKYGKRLECDMIHALGKYSEIVIKPKGKMRIGKELVTRNGFHARVENGELSIGDKCFFNLNCSITCMDSINIGAGCQIGNQVVIVDHNHTKDLTGYTTNPVTIGEKVWIGANCVILPGTFIGDGAVIGAGSVVSGEIPAHTTYYNKRQRVMVKDNDFGNCSGI